MLMTKNIVSGSPFSYHLTDYASAHTWAKTHMVTHTSGNQAQYYFTSVITLELPMLRHN